MNKSPRHEKTETAPPAPAPQTRRYDEAFKQQAVENWIKTGKTGTQIAHELGISCPSLKEWKRRDSGDRRRHTATGRSGWRRIAPSRPSWPACANSAAF